MAVTRNNKFRLRPPARCCKRGVHFSLALLLITFVTVDLLFFHLMNQTNDANLDAVTRHSGVHSVNASGRYVSLCRERLRDYHRTGNHLFLLAAAMYFAEKTGRTVLMPRCGWPLDLTFHIDDSVVSRFVDDFPCPCRPLYPPQDQVLHIDHKIDSVHGIRTLQKSDRKTLLLCGLYQTHRYADLLGPKLRQLLQFKGNIRKEADDFIETSRPDQWPVGSYVKVGVHVRRGDFLNADWVKLGITVASQQYINNAVDYFISKHERVQFVVATDDLTWTKSVFLQKFSNYSVDYDDTKTGNSTSDMLSIPRIVPTKTFNDSRLILEDHWVSVVFSESGIAGVDLAILSSCDAVVMSTGSFGWWAAWLANKTTVYYADWPQPHTALSKNFDAELYFPSGWIPLR